MCYAFDGFRRSLRTTHAILHARMASCGRPILLQGWVPGVPFTLGYIAWRPGARIGGFIRAFFDAVDLSVEAADGAERHRNLLRESLPRISDALQWTTDRPRLRMSLI